MLFCPQGRAASESRNPNEPESAAPADTQGGQRYTGILGLLQKNIGAWIFVYNVGGEIAWEDDYKNDGAELMQSAGVSYQINPPWSAGAEILHEIAVPDVDTIGDSGVFIGPTVAWRNNRFAVAVTGLWQVTALADEPDFQLHTLFPVDF